MYKPDAKSPGRDRVHMTDGGETGESEHENPNVVLVCTITKGCNAYFGHVKGKTSNLTCTVIEPAGSPLKNEAFERIEGHEGPPYSAGTKGGAEEIMSSHTTCDYNLDTPNKCKESSYVTACESNVKHGEGIVMSETND